MRRLLTAVAMLLVLSVCYAQEGHMKFKGVSMDGTLQSFTKELKSKGLALVKDGRELSVMKGKFAGQKHCKVNVFPNQAGSVYSVTVSFPIMKKWDELEDSYLKYKSMLREKYGDPVGEEEYFGYLSEKMISIKLDKYRCYSVFACQEGEVRIEIVHEKKSSCYVKLTYFDKQNRDRQRQQIMGDL